MKQKVRPFTIVIIVVDCLFGLWIVSGLVSSAKHCSSSAITYRDACNAGATIGVGIIVVFAAAVNVVLGLLWFVTKPAAPGAGQLAPGGPVRPTHGKPQPGWYPDPVNVGRLAWWDGSGWSFEGSDTSALLENPRRPDPPT